MRAKQCRYCPDSFHPDPRSYRPFPDGKGRHSVQVACRKPVCQQKRHQEACQRWHTDNPTYDDNRQDEPRANAAYMRRYRANHPDYVKRNRQGQRQRDARRKNLVNRDASALFSLGKVRGLIDLVNRDGMRTPPMRVSEEICRQLQRANRLVRRDAIALQERIKDNRGHEAVA